MSKVAPESGRASQLHAWFRDRDARKRLSKPVDDKQMVFPDIGVYDMRPNRIISVSPWACHGNVKQYVRERVKDTLPGDSRRVHEIIFDQMEQLLPAVEKVHNENLIHGNLKGNNILITENAVLQLADFGSYAPSHDHRRDQSSRRSDWHMRMVEKSEFFVSPELRRSGSPTAESDMWAVSGVFLELYFAAFKPAIYVLQESDRRTPPSEIPSDIWGLICANWAKEPRQRLKADVMHKLLNDVRRGGGGCL
ncbi:kinase-like protein [Auricularia subglabra TFB-10046 SS5]|nr:kinase-like protein [Auricularia subglabra TFB-10046 SS5]